MTLAWCTAFGSGATVAHVPALKQHLAKQGVDTAIYYPVPLHLQRALAPLGNKKGDFSVAESLAEDTLALPVFAELSSDEVRDLTQGMEQLTGGRVELDLQVDPSLLGGLVVRVGDRLIDGSVRGRLERLRNQLVSGAL